MPQMHFIDPDDFLLDSFRLGRAVYRSGFRPKHAISIWRGGTPVGLGVDAYYRSRGVFIDHTTIATGSYSGVGQQHDVIVKNLEHLAQVICAEDGLLIIDDVYETGNTIARIVELLARLARANTPRDIRVATVHRKPERMAYRALPLISLHDVAKDTWIVYPHELADLTDANDAQDALIRNKSEHIWQLLRNPPAAPQVLDFGACRHWYLSATELLRDAMALGVKVAADPWQPSFMLALWPGGVLAGLPVHEVYKYMMKKKGTDAATAPDHISINTSPTRQSYRSLVLGIQYLADHINAGDNVLIVDTTFRAGRLVNDVVLRLQEALRRNLDADRLRVATVYYNPNYDATWTSRPNILRPDYYVKQINREVIYPASVHKLPDPRRDLRRLNPALWQILYAD